MGLQFIEANGSERTLTLADMQTQDFKEAYFDLYKGLHGIKPRWETSPETMLLFFDNYEQELEECKASEQRELDYVSQRDGVQYTSWSHFYDLAEQRDHEAYVRAEEERQARLAKRAEMYRRFSPMPVIEEWLHGGFA